MDTTIDVKALHIPGAEDTTLDDADPARELESCNDLLGDPAALHRFYEANGYLLARRLLEPGTVRHAREMMLEVAARHGLIAAGDAAATWTGKPPVTGLEEDPGFRGVSKVLFGNAENLRALEKVLGEPPCFVPNVQHRIYPPGGPITPIHQDGFYSPGIHDYRPVWVPLTPCEREVGGLMIAVGEHRRGYFHNLAKPAPFPIPRGVIPRESWATTDYAPGDVLIVHPYAPHASMPNTSKRLRVTFDTRVQSSRNPTAFAGTVTAVTPGTLRMDIAELGMCTYRVDEATFIRVVHPGVNEPLSRFMDVTKPGMRLLVVFDGNHALTLRKAAEP